MSDSGVRALSSLDLLFAGSSRGRGERNGCQCGGSSEVDTIKAQADGASRWGRLKPHWYAGAVLSLGLLITAVLTVSSAFSYTNNERRLTSLETRITASVLQTAQPQLQAILGRVSGLAASSSDPAAAFRAAMSSELTPKGPFTSATLALVKDGQVHVVNHTGPAAIQALGSPATTQVFLESARSRSLVTTRVVAGKQQRLGYLLSAKGRQGVYVVGASQQLPPGRHVTVSSRSPDANLNFALYFGPVVKPEALIETDVGRLPLAGTVAKATVPFGNHVLTLVASPRGTLAGGWAEDLPWGILSLGVVFSLAAAGVTENLVRRRTRAEVLYQQQRRVSEALQRSLLPRRLPDIPDWEFAARYVPATKGVEIGGDWYSLVEVDDDHLAVVVGDVSGHDMAAAGVMAALRYTIRALAKLGSAPDEVLDRAAKELDVVTDDHLATVLVGVVNTRTREITLASAGHPPPLMVHEGRAEFLEVTPGVPLGISGPGPVLATFRFLPGSTLIAFTDGLIERRRESLETGFQRLAAAAAESPPTPGDLISHLLAELTSNDEEDDIAILAIRLTKQEVDPGTPDSTSRNALGVPDLPPTSELAQYTTQ